jgi:hypothetical protein
LLIGSRWHLHRRQWRRALRPRHLSGTRYESPKSRTLPKFGSPDCVHHRVRSKQTSAVRGLSPYAGEEEVGWLHLVGGHSIRVERTEALNGRDSILALRKEGGPDENRPYPEGQRTITVVAQESGKRYEIAARYDTPLGKIIEDVYREVGLEPTANGRLICESTGEDVSSYSRLDRGS